MWPLLFISIVSLACVLERLVYWKSSFTENEIKLNNLLNKYSNISNKITLNNTNISAIPLEKVLVDSLLIIEQCNSDGGGNIDVKLALEIAIKSIQSDLGKFTNLFSTVITISPLLGLLGTVLGLINSFSFMRLGTSGVNVEEVTGGISEALISTASGLIIAIITLIFSNYFNSLWRKENSLLNQYCGRFEMLYKRNFKS